MKLFVMSALAGLLAACANPPVSSPSLRVTDADLEKMLGEGWTGTLIYRDYSPPFGDVTLPVAIAVTQAPDGLILAIDYPDEPQANSKDLLSVREMGTRLAGDLVVARREADQVTFITTRAPCDDDGQASICEHVYTFGPSSFGMEKFVTPKDGGETIRRNAYVLTR